MEGKNSELHLNLNGQDIVIGRTGDLIRLSLTHDGKHFDGHLESGVLFDIVYEAMSVMTGRDGNGYIMPLIR